MTNVCLYDMKPQQMSGLEILNSPQTSEGDTKYYRVIKLANGLKALLVSCIPETHVTDDEDRERLAACSLCIDVGSFSDPSDIPGLAHFLEHMTFKGSTKYPSENALHQFLKQNGGFVNAQTNNEETQFYFEVTEDRLEGALDRFVNLFMEPLMLKEAMSRERDSIESEFVSKGQNDDLRRNQVLASIGQPDHPSSKFTWGNLKTLKENIEDDVLFERVHAFRRRHYSSHRMYLCVQASIPLDDLQDMVNRHWSDVPNNELPGVNLSVFDHTNAFNNEFSSKLFLMKPVSDLTLQLNLSFCLPSRLKEFKCKPFDFIAFLLGHEGTGSLGSYLRKKHYAFDLTVGVEGDGDDKNSIYFMFSVSVQLTQYGFDNIYEVIVSILRYIRFLNETKPHEYLYHEIQQIAENHFRFRNELSAVKNVYNYSKNLKYYPTELLIKGDALFIYYEPDSISAALELLADSATPMNTMITTKQPFNGHTFNRLEPWFGTQYAIVDFPAEWNELHLEDISNLPQFALPPPNQYITSDFGILLLNENDNMICDKHPVKVYESDMGEMWFRQDDRFLVPTAYYYFYLISPMFRGSPENYILSGLYPILLKMRLVERLYPAAIAGLKLECYTSEKGLVLVAKGYSHKLPLLIQVVVESLTKFASEISEHEFRAIVEMETRNYYNIIIDPESLAESLRLNVVENQAVSIFDKYHKLKYVRLDDFKRFAHQFTTQLRIQGLAQGNVNEHMAISVMTNMVDTLRCTPILDYSIVQLRTNKLTSEPSYIRCPSMNQSDTNTFTINYYQIGPISIRLSCLIDMLILIAEEPAFDTLRSKEQLGYKVEICSRDTYGILGYTISVESQENKFPAEHIDDRIEAFRAAFVDMVKNLSRSDFEQYRKSAIKLKSIDDSQLIDEMDRNWSEVVADEYMFDRENIAIACLERITQDEFTRFYVEHFESDSRKLCVQVIGRNHVEEVTSKSDSSSSSLDEIEPMESVEFASNLVEKGYLIRDVDIYQRSLESYSVSKTILN